jgi:hypothetical protein
MVSRTRDRPDTSVLAPDRPIDLRTLLGRWVNYNEHSTGISRVEIGTWEGVPTVRVFGAGPPVSVDWGEAAGAVFADGIGGDEAVAFTVTFDLVFAQVLLTGRLNRRLLVIDAYSVFADRSGRANYFQRDHLYRP